MPSKQIALVTGGMGGIGEAICRELYQHNYEVIATYHRAQKDADKWLSEQRAQGFDFKIHYADVSNFDSCQKMAEDIKSTQGEISILVNNAGITRDITFCKMETEDWHRVIETDLNSTFYMTKLFIHDMKHLQYGRIINISSINGQKGQFGQVNYCAAKSGMHGFTKALALEVAKHNITVNTISPGFVATDMVMSIADDIRNKILAEIPMRRFAAPSEIARVVAFLAHKDNGFITGANIPINGGHYML